MKQMIEMMVTIHGDKDRAKALTIGAGMTGVISVTIGGRDKNILSVIGNEVDIIGLSRSLKKKLGNASMVSVIPLNDREQGVASMRYEGNHYGNYNYNETTDYYGNYKYSEADEYCYYNHPVSRFPQYHYLCEDPHSSCSIM